MVPGDRPLRVATIGASSSANKGAAAMLQAVVDNLPSHVGPCLFDVLTTYPEADAREPPQPPVGSQVRITSFRPIALVFPLLPLALVAFALSRLGIRPDGLLRRPALQAIRQADVVLDLAGISFVDGRGLPTLVYNLLMTGIPLLLGARVVKCSQALGPFDRIDTRLAARLVLPRLKAVVARGGVTASNLVRLSLSNVHQGSDLAFALEIPGSARSRAAELVGRHLGGGSFTTVVPSEVVRGYCTRKGIDYVRIMREFLEGIVADGRRVLLLAHAVRPGLRPGRMNDVPLIREIARGSDPGFVAAITESLPPDVLRALVGAGELLVTARFHAMVSGLAEGTPLLVTGWSHKYAEVLEPFGLTELALPYSRLDPSILGERFADLARRRSDLRTRILAALPAVRAGAEVNFELVARVSREGARPR